MLCTRMRLTERRFRIKSSISCRSGSDEYESKATVTTETRSPFVRPCAVIKMFDECDSDGKEVINSNRSRNAFKGRPIINGKQGIIDDSNTDIHGSQSSLNRSEDDMSSKGSSGSQPDCRTPLIVVTLYLPSEAKTLAPIVVKRDLRRPPKFCQKYQRNSAGKPCKCKLNAKPDLVLRGKEITETSSNVCSSPSDSGEFRRNDDKSNDECIACSACTLELEADTPCVDEAALDVDFDKYHMDSYGNLNKNLDTDFAHDESLDITASVKSTPGSPDTARIIRITLNNKTSI